jgi:pimeloyl-ACP methyl ester carboxylesterase
VIPLAADVHGAGPAVVLLHGQPGTSADMRPLVGGLASDFTVVTPDRPGYGKTGGRARGFRANATAVVELLDRLNIDRATILGHSWSGGVAIALAENHPRRVSGLVLAASVGPGERLGRVDRLLAVPPIGSAITAITLATASRAVSMTPIRERLARRLGAAQEHALLAMADGWRRDAWRSFVIEQRALFDELPDLAPGLGAIDRPTAVIVGDADRIVPPPIGERLAAAIGPARLIRLPGAGHMLIYERPEAVMAAIRHVTPAVT